MVKIKELQHGGWDGGRYSYLETSPELGIYIELLENLNKSETIHKKDNDQNSKQKRKT